MKILVLKNFHSNVTFYDWKTIQSIYTLVQLVVIMMKFLFMTLIAECCAFNHVSLTNVSILRNEFKSSKFWTSKVTLTIAPECMELLKLQKDPLDCCIYPKLEADSTLSKKCKIECPSRQRGNYNCCYRACLFTKSGIYGDEKFSHEVCKGFFTFNGIQFNIQEKWREIVKESLKKCESEGKN